MTATYYRYLHELIEAVRALTETPDLPIAIGRMHSLPQLMTAKHSAIPIEI